MNHAAPSIQRDVRPPHQCSRGYITRSRCVPWNAAGPLDGRFPEASSRLVKSVQAALGVYHVPAAEMFPVQLWPSLRCSVFFSAGCRDCRTVDERGRRCGPETQATGTESKIYCTSESLRLRCNRRTTKRSVYALQLLEYSRPKVKILHLTVAVGVVSHDVSKNNRSRDTRAAQGVVVSRNMEEGTPLRF